MQKLAKEIEKGEKVTFLNPFDGLGFGFIFPDMDHKTVWRYCGNGFYRQERVKLVIKDGGARYVEHECKEGLLSFVDIRDTVDCPDFVAI